MWLLLVQKAERTGHMTTRAGLDRTGAQLAGVREWAAQGIEFMNAGDDGAVGVISPVRNGDRFIKESESRVPGRREIPY